MLFAIEGMRCGGCSAAVRNALDARDDVEAAAVPEELGLIFLVLFRDQQLDLLWHFQQELVILLVLVLVVLEVLFK